MAQFTEKLDPNEADIEAVRLALMASLDKIGRDVGYRPYSVRLSDEPGGPVIGGLYGYVLFEWLFIQYVSVPEPQQGKGIGTQLMAQAEAWARAEGLGGLWLDTFAFQARPFYEKLGFTVFGEITDHPHGSSRYFLKKHLDRR
jgi:GNAT superfamily N-acetyltransferase